MNKKMLKTEILFTVSKLGYTQASSSRRLMEMSGLRDWTKSGNIGAYFAVVDTRLIFAVMIMLSKVVFDGGMNSNIFVFYRQAAATLFLLPFAILYGCITLSLNFNALGLAYTTSTVAAASVNAIPVITFFLAVLLRMELLKWRTKSGVTKVAGIIFCIGGVAVLALYKGPGFKIIPFEKQLVHTGRNAYETHHSTVTWLKGCFSLVACSFFFFASWIVFQGSVLKEYPSKLLFTSLQCFLSMFQSFFIAIVFEQDLQEWKLGWNFRLLVIVYCGIMVTGVSYYLQSYVIEKKGPVFFSITMPLSFVITIIGSTLILGEVLTLGSVTRGILLVLGLYSVLWGKSKDPKRVESIEVIATLEVESDLSNHTDAEKLETGELYIKKKSPEGHSIV